MSAEPLLHQDIGKFVEIAKRKYHVPLVYMYTNGLLLHDELIDRFIRAGLDRLNISIDGATKPTYEAIRRGGDFDKLVANVQAVNRARERFGSLHPLLAFGYVLMRSNIEDLPAVVRLAHDLGVREVGCIHLTLHDGFRREEESLAWHKALCNRMMNAARALAQEYDIDLALPQEFVEKARRESLTQLGTALLRRTKGVTALSLPGWDGITSPDSILRVDRRKAFFDEQDIDVEVSCCPYPWHFVGIDPLGNMHPCGWWYEDPPMGNVRTQTFEEIWGNDRYRTLRAEHRSGQLRKNCRTCPAAGQADVNDGNAFTVKPLPV